MRCCAALEVSDLEIAFMEQRGRESTKAKVKTRAIHVSYLPKPEAILKNVGNDVDKKSYPPRKSNWTSRRSSGKRGLRNEEPAEHAGRSI